MAFGEALQRKTRRVLVFVPSLGPIKKTPKKSGLFG
jgi:hypothetical protein